MKTLFLLAALLLFARDALAVTRWVSAPARCVNNGDGTTNACAATPGAVGSYDGITNLDFTGLGGGDVINLFCSGDNDTFSGTVTVTVSGSAGNNLTIQSDPTSCGTPTTGLTATHYTLTGANIEFAAGIQDYITFRNFAIAPAADSSVLQRGLITVTGGVGNGIIIEHMLLDKSVATNVDADNIEGLRVNFSSATQGNTVNDTFIVRYTEVLDNNSNDNEGVGLRFLRGSGTGAMQRVQLYQNYIHDVADQCIFAGPDGENNTYNFEIYGNSLRNCGHSASSEGMWCIYGSGTRIHAHHNFCDATSNLLAGGGYRITSGGNMYEWNWLENLPNSPLSAFSLSYDGTCFEECTSVSTFRHNVAITDPSDRHLQCIRMNTNTQFEAVAENNTCYGQNSALFIVGTVSTVAVARNNLFLNIGGSGTRDVIDRSDTDGSWTIDYNLFDWTATIEDFVTSATPTNYATIAAACAALSYIGCNNKGGVGLTDSLIVHDTTRLVPAGLHSGVFGFQAMSEGEANHRTGWGFDTANAHPSGVGRPIIGAVTDWGFPCVGAYELAKTNGAVPTKFCESR